MRAAALLAATVGMVASVDTDERVYHSGFTPPSSDRGRRGRPPRTRSDAAWVRRANKQLKVVASLPTQRGVQGPGSKPSRPAW